MTRQEKINFVINQYGEYPCHMDDDDIVNYYDFHYGSSCRGYFNYAGSANRYGGSANNYGKSNKGYNRF